MAQQRMHVSPLVSDVSHQGLHVRTKEIVITVLMMHARTPGIISAC